MDDDKNVDRTRERFRVWKFLLTYICLMGLFLLLISLKSIKHLVDINGIYTRMVVRLSAGVMGPFGIVRGIDGSIIRLNGISLDVLFGCNGLEAFLIYTVAILAFPAKPRRKFVGIGIGFLVIQVVNVMRIAALGLSGIYLRRYFEIIHVYVAQGIMIAFALVLFLIWLNYATKP
jgi:exosortase H (IPTLxxWG-CTERM-specific)